MVNDSIRLCFGTYMNVLEHYLPSSITKNFFRRTLFGFINEAFVESCTDPDLAKMVTGVSNVSPQVVTPLLKMDDSELISGVSNGILKLVSVNSKSEIVIALKELLRMDTSISDDAEITIISKLTKLDLINTSEVIYDELIASIFRYTCLQSLNLSTQDEIKKLDCDFYQNIDSIKEESSVIFVKKYTLEKDRELFDEGGQFDPILIRLVLAGGWKEGCNADKLLITEFCDADLKKISRTIKELLVKGYTVFGIDNDNCQCNSHTTLLKQIAPIVFEDDIRDFFTTLDAAFFDESGTGSIIIKTNMAETMAVLGSNASRYVNCKDGLILNSIYSFEKKLFESVKDAAGWEALSPIIGMLAEAYPEAFFDFFITKKYHLNDSLFEYLSTESQMWSYRSRGVDLAWTLRRLAVFEEYYSRSIQFMFMASRNNKVFRSMLEDILWPAYSQTHASLNSRKGVIKSLFEIDEECAFELLLHEMPNQKSSTTGEVMPLYRICAPISHELDISLFYSLISFYVELLCDYSRNNLERIKELVCLVRSFKGDSREILVDTIISAYKTFSEVDKEELWFKITDYYGYYHGKIGNPKIYEEVDIEVLNSCFDSIIMDSGKYETKRIFKRNASDSLSADEEENLKSERKKVIKNLLKNDGIEALIDFSNSIEDDYEFGVLVFEILNKRQKTGFLKSCLAKCSLETQAGYVEGAGRDVSDILPALNKVSQVKLLARCGLYKEFLDGKLLYSRDEIDEFYKNVDTRYIDDLDADKVQFLLAGMSKINRYDEIVRLVHRWLYKSQGESGCSYLIDFFTKHASEVLNDNKNYAIEDIILRLLDSNTKLDKKEALAWEYCDAFYDCGDVICRCLWEKLAYEPAYFCRLIHMLHSKSKEKNQYSKCFRILQRWNIVPGTVGNTEELQFEPNKFKEWIDYIHAEKMTSDERTSAEHYVGGVLLYSPSADDFIFNSDVATYLENNSDAQIGYRVALFNNKDGFYADDDSGFASLEKVCKKNAQDAEAKGYIGIEVMFRDVAKEFHDLAEMNKKSRRTRY